MPPHRPWPGSGRNSPARPPEGRGLPVTHFPRTVDSGDPSAARRRHTGVDAHPHLRGAGVPGLGHRDGGPRRGARHEARRALPAQGPGAVAGAPHGGRAPASPIRRSRSSTCSGRVPGVPRGSLPDDHRPLREPRRAVDRARVHPQGPGVVRRPPRGAPTPPHCCRRSCPPWSSPRTRCGSRRCGLPPGRRPS